MIKKLSLIGSLSSIIFLSGCEMFNPPPQMTSLQIQAIQTREFETTKSIAFSSTMAMLQDMGYIINMASLETGFITASSPTSNNFFSGIQKTMVTAYIQPLPNGNTRVRLNFVLHSEMTQQNGGVIATDTAIYDSQTYQVAFNKLQEQIFINTPFSDKNKPAETPGMPSGIGAQ